jgi:beta-glucosidase
MAEVGGDRVSMRLHRRDIDLIRGVRGLCPNTVVSVVGSSAILIDEWAGDVPAVLFSFYGGMEGGNALADILFGDVCPGGKLPYTVAKTEADYPFFDPDCTQITYEYYHGYAKMEKEGKAVSYPFGYGLSYTSFALSAPRASVQGGTAKVTVSVTNTGAVKGAEVVQLYVGCESSAVDRPVKTLRDFARVELMPGETQEVALSFTKAGRAYFDEAADAFCEEDIPYVAYVGNSSAPDALQSVTVRFEGLRVPV